MSGTRIPEYGTPDADSPEATERDFAFARRRDGTLAAPALYLRYSLSGLRETISTGPEWPSGKRAAVLRHLDAALAELEGDISGHSIRDREVGRPDDENPAFDFSDARPWRAGDPVSSGTVRRGRPARMNDVSPDDGVRNELNEAIDAGEAVLAGHQKG